jgi:hypothetical protein
MAAVEVPDFSDDRPTYVSGFKSHGLEWKLVLKPNGNGGDGRPRLGLRLQSGWPKKASSATFLTDPSTQENANPKTNQSTNQPTSTRRS